MQRINSGKALHRTGSAQSHGEVLDKLHEHIKNVLSVALEGKNIPKNEMEETPVTLLAFRLQDKEFMPNTEDTLEKIFRKKEEYLDTL